MNTGPSPLATAACLAFVPISCFSAPAFELAAAGVPKVRVFAGLEGHRGFAGLPTGPRSPAGDGPRAGERPGDGRTATAPADGEAEAHCPLRACSPQGGPGPLPTPRARRPNCGPAAAGARP